MSALDGLRRAGQILRSDGPGALVRRIYRRVAPQRIPAHPFDVAHGVDCGGLIHRRSLRTGHPHDSHGTAYWGTAPSLLRGALARWTPTLDGTAYTVAEYTFVDIGCGKGRALLLASELPFRRIVGVELNPGLAAIASANIGRWMAKADPATVIEALHADALQVPLPDGPLLLYLYNPFDANIMHELLERIGSLTTSRRDPIDILYARPDHAELFDGVPGLQVLWHAEIPYTAEDTAADAFDTVQQECFLYRLHGGRAMSA